MGRLMRRIIFGAFLGMLISRMLRRRRGWAARDHFYPDGPGWGRHGGGRRHHTHHHHP
jgi:hypothetical protein